MMQQVMPYAIKRYFVCAVLLWSSSTQLQAESVLEQLTEAGRTGSSLEQQVSLMDTDRNGFADVYEVRAYLVSLHGVDYQKQILDRWESVASRKSCGSSFTNAAAFTETSQ